MSRRLEGGPDVLEPSCKVPPDELPGEVPVNTAIDDLEILDCVLAAQKQRHAISGTVIQPNRNGSRARLPSQRRVRWRAPHPPD